MSGQRMIRTGFKSETSEQQQQNLEKQQLRLKNIVMQNLLKKQSSGVSFSGVIKSGVFKDDSTLSVMYFLSFGKNWNIIAGQQSGISFKSQASEGRIIWSFPFGIVFQSQNKDVKEWPQIIVVIYGTDYFGRSMPRGYGNVHLPTSQGTHNRKIRIFRPLQPTTFFWSCLNLMTNSIMQIKQPQKFLGESAQRKNLRVQYSGQIQLEIETKRINLQMHGYKK